MYITCKAFIGLTLTPCPHRPLKLIYNQKITWARTKKGRYTKYLLVSRWFFSHSSLHLSPRGMSLLVGMKKLNSEMSQPDSRKNSWIPDSMSVRHRIMLGDTDFSSFLLLTSSSLPLSLTLLISFLFFPYLLSLLVPLTNYSLSVISFTSVTSSNL